MASDFSPNNANSIIFTKLLSNESSSSAPWCSCNGVTNQSVVIHPIIQLLPIFFDESHDLLKFV